MNKPFISYYKNAQKRSEAYILNGKLHRTDGPAYISWHENGHKWAEVYHLNGQFHRTDGPAYISWYPNGQRHSEQYRLNGEKIKVSSDLEFKKIVKLMPFK